MKGTITIAGTKADAAAQRADQKKKQMAIKDCTIFTNCISQINNT